MAEKNEFEMTAEERKKQGELQAKTKRDCYLIKAGGLAVWCTEPTIPDVDCWMSESTNGLVSLVDLLRRNLAEGAADEIFKGKPAAVVPIAKAYVAAIGLGAEAYLGK